ncbi:hypothetical protein AAG906_010532 [Vitis piasezkii]
MSSQKFEVEKFNGSNDFTLWKLKMKALLVQQNEMKFEGSSDETTTVGLWRKLESKYRKVSDQMCFIEKAIAYFEDVKVCDLNGVGVKVEEEDQAMILLCSLPSSYENFVDTMIMERNGGGRSKSRSKSKAAMRCFHCKEKWHFRKNSTKVVVAQKDSEKQDSSDEGEGGDVLTVSTSSSAESWILDTGASYHMAYSRDLFTTFKEWNGSVKLGDDGELGVKGSGSVQIKMYDGLVRTLNAWYVPGLRKNLISVGTLDKNGYTFSGSGGVLRVSKGALVVMKGRLQHGIYTLMGSSVLGTMCQAPWLLIQRRKIIVLSCGIKIGTHE